MKKFRKVEIKWLDAQTGFSQSMDISEFKKTIEPCYNYSFGYLLEKNKDYVIVGFLVIDIESKHSYEPMVKHWQLIPRGMIKSMRFIK